MYMQAHPYTIWQISDVINAVSLTYIDQITNTSEMDLYLISTDIAEDRCTIMNKTALVSYVQNVSFMWITQMSMLLSVIIAVKCTIYLLSVINHRFSHQSCLSTIQEEEF